MLGVPFNFFYNIIHKRTIFQCSGELDIDFEEKRYCFSTIASTLPKKYSHGNITLINYIKTIFSDFRCFINFRYFMKYTVPSQNSLQQFYGKIIFELMLKSSLFCLFCDIGLCKASKNIRVWQRIGCPAC